LRGYRLRGYVVEQPRVRNAGGAGANIHQRAAVGHRPIFAELHTQQCTAARAHKQCAAAIAGVIVAQHHIGERENTGAQDAGTVAPAPRWMIRSLKLTCCAALMVPGRTKSLPVNTMPGLPRIVTRLLSRTNVPPNTMPPLNPPLKSMALPAAASAMALRSEPGPLSQSVVTVGVLEFS